MVTRRQLAKRPLNTASLKKMTKPPQPPVLGETAAEQIQSMAAFSPQIRSLGLIVTRVERARVWGRAPYRADLVGDPDTGVIAGGVVTTFLDHLCGSAVAAALTSVERLATIDLRIDYLRAAKPGLDILAEAHCYRVTRHVAFVRALAYEASPDDPVANAVATFAIGPQPAPAETGGGAHGAER